MKRNVMCVSKYMFLSQYIAIMYMSNLSGEAEIQNSNVKANSVVM